MSARFASGTAMAFVWLPVFGVAGAACGGNGSRAVPGGCPTIGIDVADVASSIGWTPTASHAVPGDLQSCEFGSGARHLQVSIRPTLGRVTVESWIDGRMPLHASSFAGAGEAAVWQPELRELIAERNDVLCDVWVSGGEMDTTSAASTDLARRLANLCNKIFAPSLPAADSAPHSLWRRK